MAWYDEAVFYHIYPLGLTGAPKQNSYGEPEHRLNTLLPWIGHIREIGCNALYIGPLFESVGHGYETTDYRKLDSRLGTNEDLTNFVAECHRQGVKVILDGVFNHVGRDFFAFRDLKEKREGSPYRDWFCNVNFYGNNEYNDGFSYDNWGGYNLLVKLNQRNPAVRDYICDVIRFWVDQFDIDGLRLDAADVLDFDFMKQLRYTANEVKTDFWLMGEVIHGDYTRWVNQQTLHSVTNYHLHKALYSGHNDHNYFEIAHTVKRLYDMGGNRPDGLKLYNFADNHDVERIYTKLNQKAHFTPVHILMYTLPGVPSVYYGSEFGIEGKKERFSDDSLRPALSLDNFSDALTNNSCTRLIAALGKIRQRTRELSYGAYRELLLTNRQYAFSRTLDGSSVIVTVNNDESDYVMTVPGASASEYIGALSGQRVSVNNGTICVNVKANSGDIWIPATQEAESLAGETAEETVEEAGNEAEQATVEETADKAEQTTKEEAGTGQVTVEETADEAEQVTKEETGAGTEQTTVEETADETEQATKEEAGAGTEQATVEETAGKAEQTVAEGSATKTTQTTTEKTSTETEQTTVEVTATTAQPVEAPTATAPAQSSLDAIETAKKEAFEQGRIAGLQEAILSLLEKRGSLNDRTRRDVEENVYHDSLINWIKSF